MIAPVRCVFRLKETGTHFGWEAIGAGAGTAAAFITGKKNIRLPPETHLTFKLVEPLTIDAKS